MTNTRESIADPSRSPHPTRGVWLGLVVALAVLGIIDGAYLTMVHVDYELSPDSMLRAVCGALASNGCAVTVGRFGAIAGVPVSVIGFGGAAATAVTATLAWRHRERPRDRWRSTTLLLATISVLASMVMATLSSIEGSFCPFCVAWYGINASMAIAALVAWRTGTRTSVGRVVVDTWGTPGVVAATTMCFALAIGYGGYLQLRSAAMVERANAALERLLDGEQPVELDLEGLPSEGPADAVVTLVEVADFECPYCAELWASTREYTEKSETEVRVVFVPFPVDDSCNESVVGVHMMACAAARAAQCAERHDAFFEYGDLLFDNQYALKREDLVDYATQLGIPAGEFEECLDDPEVDRELRERIRRARKMGIATTPTFFVNGFKFKGARDPQWMRLVLDGFARRVDG
ncbi:MAG: thioredoxin domain-containing protein [Deltaproteobacteria bacterium]|nr:thioredoxin domain-containing protein [Deltaproteobacteria bacterium]